MKSSFLKIAVFAITLFCSQLAFGQSGKVVCYDDNSWYQDIWIDAPYFNGDLATEVTDENNIADAWIQWDGGLASKYCGAGASNCGFENIGRQDAGGINVSIGCETYGYGSWSVAEAWAEW